MRAIMMMVGLFLNISMAQAEGTSWIEVDSLVPGNTFVHSEDGKPYLSLNSTDTKAALSASDAAALFPIGQELVVPSSGELDKGGSTPLVRFMADVKASGLQKDAVETLKDASVKLISIVELDLKTQGGKSIVQGIKLKYLLSIDCHCE